MATVDFGIIREMDEVRDYGVVASYPALLAEFECISVCDEVAERWFERLSDLPVSYSSLRRRGRGPDICGVSIVSHEYVPALLRVIREDLREDFGSKGGVCGQSDCAFEGVHSEDLFVLLEEIIRTRSYLICFGI